tara:strand:+ start:429 stop:1283 length:855 start_codon:yes stop_codon:yes gene_type:complete
MKILICGSSGDVGQDLIKLLSKKNYKIVAASRSKISNKIKKKQIKYLITDFSKKFKIYQKFDLIINCIATHEFSKTKKLTDYLNSNVFALINILKKYNNTDIKILNLSTISIFDLTKYSILREDHTSIINNNLSVTKFIGEKVLSLGNPQTINVRLPGVLTTSKNYFRPWLKNIVNKISNNEDIQLYNSKKKFNSVIDTYEIVRFIDHILKKKFVSGTYNLSANKPINLSQLILTIKTNLKSTSKVKNLGNNKSNTIISNNLIKTKLKFKPSTVMQIVLRYLND